MVNRCGWYLEWSMHWLLENEERVRRRVLFNRGEGHTGVEKHRKMPIEKAQHPMSEQ